MDGVKRSITTQHQICPIAYSAGMRAAERSFSLAKSSATGSKNFIAIEEAEVWLRGMLCLEFCV